MRSATRYYSLGNRRDVLTHLCASKHRVRICFATGVIIINIYYVNSKRVRNGYFDVWTMSLYTDHHWGETHYHKYPYDAARSFFEFPNMLGDMTKKMTDVDIVQVGILDDDEI